MEDYNVSIIIMLGSADGKRGAGLWWLMRLLSGGMLLIVGPSPIDSATFASDITLLMLGQIIGGRHLDSRKHLPDLGMLLQLCSWNL